MPPASKGAKKSIGPISAERLWGKKYKFTRTRKVQNQGNLPRKESLHMSTPAQKAFFAALAAFARASADLLDEQGEAPTATAPAAAAPAKPKPPPKAAAAAAPAPAAAAPAATPAAAAPAAAAPNGAGDITAQVRKAAKDYAGVYGREGLKEVLGKFTTGTVADVPADKLPELLASLSG